MRNSHRFPVAFTVVLALAACQKPADEKAATTDAAAGEAPGVATPAGPVTMPRLKAGLWEMTTDQGPPGANRLCIDEALQRKMSVLGGGEAMGDCSETSVTPKSGGGYVIHSVCTPGGPGSGMGTSRSEGEVSGDFQTHYETRFTVTTEGASMPALNRTGTVSSSATYLGPCPADMKSGDLQMSTGMRVNIAEMAETVAQHRAAR